MQPSARQSSRKSLFSWWSDSNPGLQGPTINIHTIAKPLARFLYHRQAMQFMEQDAGAPLTPTMAEIYSTYLLCKYVSFKTQSEVLTELGNRALVESEASVIVASSALGKVLQLLEASNVLVRERACRLVHNLARHGVTPSLLDITCSVQLVSCLDDEDPRVVEHAIGALAHTALRVDGAEAIVQAEVQGQLIQLLVSANEVVRDSACRLVRNLARHKITAPTTWEVNLVTQLVSCLDDENPMMVQSAIDALTNAAMWEGGSEAVAAQVQGNLHKIFESSHLGVQESACRLVANLSQHEVTEAITVKTNPYVQLVSRLDDKDAKVVKHAIKTLARQAYWKDGAEAVVRAKVQGHILKLLRSTDRGVRESACRIVENLARYGTTAPLVLEINPCPMLAALLHEPEYTLCSMAIYALAWISKWPNGVSLMAGLGLSKVLQGLILPPSYIYDANISDELNMNTIQANLSRHAKKSASPEITEPRGFPKRRR